MERTSVLIPPQSHARLWKHLQQTQLPGVPPQYWLFCKSTLKEDNPPNILLHKESFRPLGDQSFQIATWPLPEGLGPISKNQTTSFLSQCKTCPLSSPCCFRAILFQRTLSHLSGPSQQDSLMLTLQDVGFGILVPSIPGYPGFLEPIGPPLPQGLCFLVQIASQFSKSNNKL